MTGGSKTIDGDCSVNYLKLESGYTNTLKVTGTTTIDSNISKDAASNSTITNIVNNSKLDGSKIVACYIGKGSIFESASIIFNSSTTHYPQSFNVVEGAVKTDSFIIKASDGYTAKLNLTSSARIESLSGEPGTLEIGANASVKVGNATKSAKGSIGLETVVNGGSLHVNHYASMKGITLKEGDVLINLDNFVSDNYAGVPLEEAIDLGDIAVEGGTLSLDKTAITSDVTMTGGELQITGDVETGALELANVDVIFSADATIDLGGEELILGDNIAITLNVDSLDNIAGVELFKTTGNVSGLDELTVTFMDATGATKEAAVSFSNGSVVTGSVPEPTTATLSLLALAGLAARRRRR